MNELISFCNLKRQYNNHREDFLNSIDEVCSKAAFVDGEYVRDFEREFSEFCQVPYASCVNSGTSAIFLSMLALGIKAGDEVIVPASTFIASAWGSVYAGAKPVFVDCTNDTWEIDPKKIENAITDKTKAIIGVHLYGLPFDVDAVRTIADKHNLFLVEDCAQAHGAKYKNRVAGGLCDIGCFSFYPTKNLGAFGQGGCVTSNNFQIIQHINLLRNYARNEHNEHMETGFNMRMDGIQAAVLSYKLRLLENINQRRIEIAKQFRQGINNPCIAMQEIPEGIHSAYNLFVITVPDRDKFIQYLYSKNIECGIHYKTPCHLQSAFRYLGYKPGDLQNSEYLADHCVSLPLYPELLDNEINRIIDACNNFDGGLVL